MIVKISLFAILLTFIHYVGHSLASLDGLNGILNALAVTVIVYIAYLLLRKPILNRATIKNNGRRNGLIVAGLHLVAHVIASAGLSVPIISTTTIGIAGTTVLVSAFVIETWFSRGN